MDWPGLSSSLDPRPIGSFPGPVSPRGSQRPLLARSRSCVERLLVQLEWLEGALELVIDDLHELDCEDALAGLEVPVVSANTVRTNMRHIYSDAIPDAVRLLGRYLTTRSSASLNSSPTRSSTRTRAARPSLAHASSG